LRKAQFAARYGITIRMLERMIADGRLPAPDLRLGRLPMWSSQTIEENERRAAAHRPAKSTNKQIVGEATA
jgi:hypothetical protein